VALHSLPPRHWSVDAHPERVRHDRRRQEANAANAVFLACRACKPRAANCAVDRARLCDAREPYEAPTLPPRPVRTKQSAVTLMRLSPDQGKL
jgi:hypothetical protein